MTDVYVPAPHDPGTCQNCFFSEQDTTGQWRCHRATPIAVANGTAYWPPVNADDWCAFGWYNGNYYTPDGAKP